MTIPLILTGKVADAYAVRDQYRDAHDAGNVNATLTTDRKNVRAVTDADGYATTNLVSIYNVLMFGDSKTSGSTAPYTMCNVSRLCLEIPARIGTPGITLAGRLATLDADLAACSGVPDFICFNLGANDAVALPAEATWKANALNILDSMHAKWPGAQIYIARTWRHTYETESHTLNDWQNWLVTQRSFCHAGIDEWVVLEAGDGGATWATDGTHPNTGSGYYRVAQYWATALGI